ncbi:hypothetical protein A2348_03760 [Candidatus Uhrbacteria bacterium RIFOXYB12_FULL_58_10]|uniref:Haloacid dehalogenase n=1 Tax=Candidatus Uhrbacteria bacterium RIFOXYB2_FULL_57_15 TaxID=1802422 RepID=A0A1F7WB23_9BACT|nr:MAG: hypothetical protein A2348_03760 [Candidatus Uhrbacteria bacterium RIFOXYB12_FULL_58_10]OGL99417.1 MAG: hypothetical protein A2304_01335 [Candidatus Uhrbacteria bacterium RIFOXYB2_FULL_57_15]OGL99860.1 MAG: hypothetical protein A2501_05540 [Candidatus Uhrbacteria bacterium RIFOXYC12_FULL_57_11]
MTKCPASFISVAKAYAQEASARKVVMGRSNDALSRSKRAIFALHRGDVSGAVTSLREIKTELAELDRHFRKFPTLLTEGSYQAALEEFAEAQLFASYLEHGTFGSMAERTMRSDVYLAGLCDATGEVVRFATREVIAGRPEAVRAAFETVDMVIEYLLNMDLTGYLRTKFDQAKRNLRSLEQMSYELSVRK